MIQPIFIFVVPMNCLFDDQALQAYAKEYKLQPFRVKQILYEIYKNQTIDIDEMTTLSKELRQDLKTKFETLALSVEKKLEDQQTTKIAFKTEDGHIIETVIIYHRQDDKYVKNDTPKLNRITICVSSQVGCPVNCLFCVTGKLGFTRNLTRQEIISQILFANSYIKQKFGKKEDGTLYAVRNVVFMGMGEPLLNYDEMKSAIGIMLKQDRLSLSKRHITISTAGIIPGIKKLIEDHMDVKLAISLHCADQEIRQRIMPIAKSYPLKDLMQAIDQYVKATDNRIFYEYIMIKNITDTPELADKLIDLLQGRLAHVNLIPYNTNPAIELQESETHRIRQFKKILEEGGLTVTIRDSMGREVQSACGQLGYEKVATKQ